MPAPHLQQSVSKVACYVLKGLVSLAHFYSGVPGLLEGFDPAAGGLQQGFGLQARFVSIIQLRQQLLLLLFQSPGFHNEVCSLRLDKG